MRLDVPGTVGSVAVEGAEVGLDGFERGEGRDRSRGGEVWLREGELFGRAGEGGFRS
jgi:hypothetical protein